MATITEVCNALKTALEAIDGLHVYAFPPDQIQPPAAVISLGDGDFVVYDSAAGSDDLELTVALFAKGIQNRSVFEAINGYVLGAGSIRAAVEADYDLGGIVSSVRVRTARNFGMFTYGASEIKHPGCEFPIEVLL
jgi:hypothetical protein